MLINVDRERVKIKNLHDVLETPKSDSKQLASNMQQKSTNTDKPMTRLAELTKGVVQFQKLMFFITEQKIFSLNR